MKFFRVAAAAVIAVSFGSGEVQAQSLSNKAVPAEFPPASYSGRQYVDSNGCVFIRAGVDGTTTWVPRVTRSRKQICGFKPTGVARTAAAAPAQPVQPAAPKPQPASAPKPTPAPSTTAQQVVRRVPAAAGQPATSRVPAAATTAVNTATNVIRTVPASPLATAAATVAPSALATAVPKQVTTAARSTGRTVTTRRVPIDICASGSSTHVSGGRSYQVRCGSQTDPHVNYRAATAAALRSVATPVQAARPAQGTVIYRSGAGYTPYATAPAAQGLRVPEGYQLVWDDDRLNPNRGPRSATGNAQTEQVWTNTVPRELVSNRTGRTAAYAYSTPQYVTTANPQYITNSTASAYATGVYVSTQGKVLGDTRTRKNAPVVRRTGREGLKQLKARTVKTVSKPAKQQQVTVSTRSAATRTAKAQPAKPQTASSGKRYVQAGMFGVPGNAQRAVQRISGAGLPARTSQVTHKGKSYTVVLAGPFQSQAQLNSGLQRVRGLGFGDAFTR